MPLKIVGDGPERARLEARAPGRACEFLGRAVRRRGARAVSRRARSCCCRAKRTSASCRSRRRPAAARSSRSRAAARSKRSSTARPGVLVDEPTPEAFADAIRSAHRDRHRFDAGRSSARHAERFGRERFGDEMASAHRRGRADRRGRAMVKRYNRLLVAFYVVSDALLGIVGVHPRLRDPVPDRPDPGRPRATRPSSSTSTSCRSSRCSCRSAFQLQGLYRLRRGRSRVDDFFAVFVGSILAVVFGIVATLYMQTYYVPDAAEGPRRLRGLAAGLGDLPRAQRRADFASRELVREVARAPLARRHRPEADPDRRLGRARPPGRRQDPRAPRARLPDRRLRRRPRRRRSPRLPRPAAARHARRGGGDHCSASGSITSTSRCRSSEHVQMLELAREHEPRDGRRQGRARPAAGHRAARAPRGSRRRPDHQHQRRAAAGLQQRASSARIDVAISASAPAGAARHPARPSSRSSSG